MNLIRKKNKDINQEVLEKSKAAVKRNGLPKYVMTSNEKLDIAKYFIPIIAIILLIIIEVMVGKIILGPSTLKITEQTVQLTQLKTDFDLMSNQYKDLVSQKSSFDDYSYYTGDTSENDLAAVEFFSHICTWSDSSTYESLRQEMFRAGYTSESGLMKALLPEPVTYYDEENKNMLYSIDLNKDNMKFESIKSYPISSEAGKNKYAGILVVSSVDMSAEGMNQEYFGYVYVDYVIENDKCTEVNAEALIRQ
ncbi:MAG: hypothetical protein K2O91_03945 [Lachnospiraceae bacterium]|nr:hypothetical protein [Lachnospiraceae bacterium]